MLRTLVPVLVTAGGVCHVMSLSVRGGTGRGGGGPIAGSPCVAIWLANGFGARPVMRSRAARPSRKNALSRGVGRRRATKRAALASPPRVVLGRPASVPGPFAFDMTASLGAHVCRRCHLPASRWQPPHNGCRVVSPPSGALGPASTQRGDPCAP